MKSFLKSLLLYAGILALFVLAGSIVTIAEFQFWVWPNLGFHIDPLDGKGVKLADPLSALLLAPFWVGAILLHLLGQMGENFKVIFLAALFLGGWMALYFAAAQNYALRFLLYRGLSKNRTRLTQQLANRLKTNSLNSDSLVSVLNGAAEKKATFPKASRLVLSILFRKLPLNKFLAGAKDVNDSPEGVSGFVADKMIQAAKPGFVLPMVIAIGQLMSVGLLRLLIP